VHSFGDTNPRAPTGKVKLLWITSHHTVITQTVHRGFSDSPETLRLATLCPMTLDLLNTNQ